MSKQAYYSRIKFFTARKFLLEALLQGLNKEVVEKKEWKSLFVKTNIFLHFWDRHNSNLSNQSNAFVSQVSARE